MKNRRSVPLISDQIKNQLFNLYTVLCCYDSCYTVHVCVLLCCFFVMVSYCSSQVISHVLGFVVVVIVEPPLNLLSY